MDNLTQQVRNQLSDEDRRRSLVAAAAHREKRLRELGKLDLDCQLLQLDGRPLQARSLYQKTVALEQELRLS